jgi:hypothetical protein
MWRVLDTNTNIRPPSAFLCCRPLFSVGMNIYAAAFLLPVGVMFYTAQGGLKASYVASWANTGKHTWTGYWEGVWGLVGLAAGLLESCRVRCGESCFTYLITYMARETPSIMLGANRLMGQHHIQHQHQKSLETASRKTLDSSQLHPRQFTQHRVASRPATSPQGLTQVRADLKCDWTTQQG